MPIALQRWLKIALFNLCLVATIGCILRYKIVYPLPFLDQKNLLHAHSHFAFTGWITQALMALMVATLTRAYGEDIFKKYRWILYANLITAYGMLFTFPVEGYGVFSISFSTLSIFANYIFAIRFWIDMNRMKQKNTGHYWFRAALLFNVLSSLGAFGLAWMMATRNIHLQQYLGAIYFYLHFQYNGWFFFAGMGLLTTQVFVPVVKERVLKGIFWLFALACIPAFFLSAFWMSIPVIVFIVVIIAAFMQLVGWVWMLGLIKQQQAYIKTLFPKPARRILMLSAIALCIKLLLQLGSTIPSLSNLAFGFRPIVIGYLHLVLLGVITLFLLGYMTGCAFLFSNKSLSWGVTIFAAGIIINEVFLMIQGAGGMGYITIPYLNESLLVAACIMMTGILTITLSQFKKRKNDLNHKTSNANVPHL